MNKISKVAIANRGEVAVRIIRACKELGLETALLYAEPDQKSMAYREADETICIGPAESAQSYLNINANIQGALALGVDAIHPGFGFLSENAQFARACDENGLIFIGPSPDSIELFGDKISAKKLVEQLKIPTIPGYLGDHSSIELLMSKCEEIGYPLIVKAAAGGGGRGLRLIERKEQARSAIEASQREGLASFGSAAVFLERYLNRAKHIEVQVFGEASGKMHCLFERECSIQRRHQKIIEEAPSPSISPDIRAKLMAASKKIAEASGYRGAGTVEFLVQNDEYFFLEMNTRLQVEHTVTEMVLQKDLVKAQLLTAQNIPLLWQEDTRPQGHAIECRIVAEDPYQAGVPSTGELGFCSWPMGPGRRFEIGFAEKDEITPYYDPMIAKVVVWDETRTRAIAKMRQTLREIVLFGVKTNIPFLIEMLDHYEFREATMTTQFIAKHFAEGLKPLDLSETQAELAKQLWSQLGEGSQSESSSREGRATTLTPWLANWRSK